MVRSSVRLALPVCVCLLLIASVALGGEVTFQQEVAGYTSTVDTFIQQDPANAGTDNGAATEIGWDADDPIGDGYEVYALLRFDRLFGSRPGQVPPGETIQQATLYLNTFNPGDEGTLHSVLLPWVGRSSFQRFCGASCQEGVQHGPEIGRVPGELGGSAVDVTASVQAWARGSRNLGWIIRPVADGNNGVDVRSSEYGDRAARPRLVVRYGAIERICVGDRDCDDGVSCTRDLCDGGLCVRADACPERQACDRTTGECSAAPLEDFSIVVLPDTQNYSRSFPDVFNDQTQWIVDHRDEHNIELVVHTGDIVEDGGVLSEWQVADEALGRLENTGARGLERSIPYIVAAGNHDQTPLGYPGDIADEDGSTPLYNEFFGVERFRRRPHYGSRYADSNDNHYSLFSAGGAHFIVISLEYAPSDTALRQSVLAWADGVLQRFPDRRAIVVSHYTTEMGNPAPFGNQGQAIYDALKRHPQLFLMLSGHIHGEGRRSDTFDGSTVYSLLGNYQTRPSGGNGWLRILEFNHAADEIRVRTYSPWLDGFETDDDSEFTLAYDLPDCLVDLDCDDGVACTEDRCSSGACSSSDTCGAGASCNPSTGHCDQVLTFREGVAAYTGCRDTFVQEADAEMNNADLDNWEWDGEDGNPAGENVGLLRFDNVVGNGAGLIAPGSDVASATLRLVLFNPSTPPAGDIRELAVDWSESTVTWNNLGDDPGVQPDDLGEFVAASPMQSGIAEIDVTESLQRWVDDPTANNGWIFLPNSNDGVQVWSSEAATLADRPLLTVELAGGCAVDADCDDGLFCNGIERCGAAASCGHGFAPCGRRSCSEAVRACVISLRDEPVPAIREAPTQVRLRP